MLNITHYREKADILDAGSIDQIVVSRSSEECDEVSVFLTTIHTHKII